MRMRFRKCAFACYLTLPLSFLLANSLLSAQSMLVKASAKTNSSPISSSLERQFKRDAARISLRIDSEKEEVRYLPVAISRDQLNGIYKALVNIYSNDESAKSIARCNIHTFPNPSIDHLTIIYKRTAEWAAPLRQGVSETTNKDFNRLLDQYELAIEKHVQWNDTQDAVTLRSKEPLNMAALAASFENIPGVIQIDLGLPKFGGNDVKAKRIGGGWEIDFILQINSGGSLKQHVWKYRALDSGQVSFVQEVGEPIPSWMKCQNGDFNTLSYRF